MENQQFFNIGLPQLPVNTDPKIEEDLRAAYNSIRNLSKLVGQFGLFETPSSAYQTPTQAAYTSGVAKQRVYAAATEAVSYGAALHLYDVAGVLSARFANATDNTRPCKGFCNSPGTATIGAMVEVVLPGNSITSVSGLTSGTSYYLSTTNGTITNVAPAVPGNIRELLGFALNSGVFFFFPNLDFFVV